MTLSPQVQMQMQVGQNMYDGYSIGKTYLNEKCHDYPTKVQGNKKCGRSGCSKKSNAMDQYWCAHCRTWYCVEHRHNHKLNMTKCHGINNKWVIQGSNLYKGRCDFHELIRGTTQTTNCGVYCSFYCGHCKKWYCQKHSNYHYRSPRRNDFTKCNGIKNDMVIAVSKKGDKGKYVNDDSCCIIL